MRIDKKEIRKEDGRTLVFYHFPDSATAEQKAAFEAVETVAPTTENGEAAASPNTTRVEKDGPRV